MAGGDRSGSQHVVRVADDGDTGGDREQSTDVRRGDARKSGRGQSTRDGADQAHPDVVTEHGDDDRGEHHAEQGTGKLWRPPPHRQDQNQRAGTDAERGTMNGPELGQELPDAGEEPIGGDRNRGEGGDLAAQQGETHPGDVADQNRLGERRSEKAELGDRSHDADRTHRQSQSGHECDVTIRVPGRQRGDSGCRQDGGARLRTHPEVATGANRGVHDQRPKHRVEPVLGGHAGEFGIRHRLWNQHGPDREPGDQVGTKPGGLVVEEDSNTREQVEGTGPPAFVMHLPSVNPRQRRPAGVDLSAGDDGRGRRDAALAGRSPATYGDHSISGQQRHRSDAGGDRSQVDGMTGIGPGGGPVDDRCPEHGVARQVHQTPQSAGQAVHRQGGDLDGHQQVHGGDTPGDRARPPLRRQRNEDVDWTECDIVVGDQRRDMDPGEGDRKTAEEPVQIQEPLGTGATLQQPGAEEQSPGHRHGEQNERHHPGGAGDVPGELLVHCR